MYIDVRSHSKVAYTITNFITNTFSNNGGLSINVTHSGLPDNAFFVLRRKRKSSNRSNYTGKVDVNTVRYSYLGDYVGYEYGNVYNYSQDDYNELKNRVNIIPSIRAMEIPIPKEAGTHNIDLYPYLHFIKRGYKDLSGNGVNESIEHLFTSGNLYNMNLFDKESYAGRMIETLQLVVMYKVADKGNIQTRYHIGSIINLRWNGVYNPDS